MLWANSDNRLIPHISLDSIHDNNLDLYNQIMDYINDDNYSDLDYLWDHSGAGYHYYFGG